MKPWARWVYLIAVSAVTFVAVTSITLAIRQDSWSPIISVGWIPAVVVATWPGGRRHCLPRRKSRTS